MSEDTDLFAAFLVLLIAVLLYIYQPDLSIGGWLP
jgi:hypothetical protein